MPKLSAIWICSRKDFGLKETLGRYLAALSSLPCDCELTVVGNGDVQQQSGELLPVLRQSDIPSTIVNLHRHCDESTAILAGVSASEGELIAILPSYVQTDPAELHRMLTKLESGYDYVASWRNPRADARRFGLKSALFNRVTRALTGVPLHDLNSGLRLMRREVTEHVPIYGELHRYLPVLAAKQGYRVTEIKTRHLEERVKKGDYRVGIYLRRLLDLLALFFLLKFTRKPLRFFGLLGSAMLAVGGMTIAVLIGQRFLGTALADRPALIFGVLLVVLGIQLFSLGLLGELIIYTHGRSMREYQVKSVFKASEDNPAAAETEGSEDQKAGCGVA